MTQTKVTLKPKPPVSAEVKQVRELRARVETLEAVVEALASGNLHAAQERLGIVK